MKWLKLDGTLGPLSVKEYVRLGVMPFQEFDEAKRAQINDACLEPYPPDREIRFLLCSMMSRAYFEWHIRRGRDPRKARPSTPPELRLHIAERDGWICGLCGGAIAGPTDLHIDHIKPLSLGGKHVAGNLQAAHARCNLAKGNRVTVARDSLATRADVASDSVATNPRVTNDARDTDGATR